MEEKKIEGEQPEGKRKLSYEELNQYAHQLSSQMYQMQEKMREMDMTRAFMRLDYLFRVVDSSDKFPDEFVMDCIDEIRVAMARRPAVEEKSNGDGETKTAE